MPFETFNELYGEVLGFYGEQRYKEVYDLLAAEGDAFPDEAFTLLYLRSCMAARLGRHEHAIELIREAEERDVWYGEVLMRQTPSWQPLQGVPAFEELVSRFKEREREHAAAPLMIVNEPPGGCSTQAPCPLLVSLHGNAANARRSVEGWRAVLDMGWIHAALQSSQLISADAFVWDDQEVALREIAAHYADLAARYEVDRERVVLAGFSMGGETALRAALLGTVPVAGLILLGPGGPTMDNTQEWLAVLEEARARGRKLRGYIVVGDNEEPGLPEGVKRLAPLLNSHGVPCELEEVSGLAHEYPRDFGPIIRRALDFIFGR